jgi:uncharacterized membrane protein
MHFLRPAIFLKIMPPWVPRPRFMVYASGFFEILFGVLLLIPASSTLAAWGLILLLIAVFPANLHMALNADQFSRIPKWLLYMRLPLQLVLIGWAWMYT